MPQFPCVFQNNNMLNYLVFLPEGYDEKNDEKYPAILFLHGVGERGDDLELLKKHGIPKIVEQNPSFEFITISPQCPGDSSWIFETDRLNELLNYVISKYNIDTNRIYLTGLSMGGTGTWLLAVKCSKRFAAIAPICGRKYLHNIKELRHTPVWLFHGGKDNCTNVQDSIDMADALKSIGCDVKLTVYPDAGHNVWTQIYESTELYEWFLKHSSAV